MPAQIERAAMRTSISVGMCVRGSLNFPWRIGMDLKLSYLSAGRKGGVFGQPYDHSQSRRWARAKGAAAWVPQEPRTCAGRARVADGGVECQKDFSG